MQNSVSYNIQEAAKALLKAVRIPGANISACLNSTLNQFLTWPFKAGPISILDSEGKGTHCNTVIYTGSEQHSENQPTEVQADLVACGIHVAEKIGLEELKAGYDRIAFIKRLKRTQIPEINYPLNNIPLGLIFAVNSDMALDKIANLVISLNKDYPSSEWPDMVVILTHGTINYAVQILGESITGDFLLPNRTDFPVMPMYIHVLMRNLELLSLNKMCDLLFAHLKTFSPGTKLPTTDEILKDVSPSGITLGAYQYNLKRQLVPVPTELYSQGNSFASKPFRIEDNKGSLLSHLQFIRWQDGGVIRLAGKLPLDGVLVFLGAIAKDAKIIKQPKGAISSVLPIQETQFREMLDRFQRQSNMKVIPEGSKFIFQKVSDEGTTSPFIARLHLGILSLRDAVFTEDKKRKEFDTFYQVVLDTLTNARTTSGEIIQILNEHRHKVSQGKIARIKQHAIQIDESIDNKLRKHVEEFLNGTVRVVKDGMQNLLKFMKIDIGFLYRNQGAFENGIKVLAKTHPELAAYLKETRKWSERLIPVRNSLHEGWMLDKVNYKETYDGIQAVEPQILGQSVSEFVEFMLDRLCCFVEEVTTYALQTRMSDGISIKEIPITERRIDCCERFKQNFIDGEESNWKISYHISKFEET